MRRRHSTLVIVGLLFDGMLARVVSAALGIAPYAIFGTIANGGALTPTARP